MKNAPTQTIIQQIQPQCNALHLRIKDEKDKQHETNQSIANNTGVPISNVAKLLSGALSSPSVYYVAAICIYLGISLDGLFDIEPEKPERESETRIVELETQLDGAEKQVALLEERSKLLEAGIKERKPIIYGLAGMCVFLAVALFCYIVIDIKDQEHGLFTASNLSDSIGLLCIFITAVMLVLLHFITKIVVNRKKENR